MHNAHTHTHGISSLSVCWIINLKESHTDKPPAEDCPLPELQHCTHPPHPWGVWLPPWWTSVGLQCLHLECCGSRGPWRGTPEAFHVRERETSICCMMIMMCCLKGGQFHHFAAFCLKRIKFNCGVYKIAPPDHKLHKHCKRVCATSSRESVCYKQQERERKNTQILWKGIPVLISVRVIACIVLRHVGCQLSTSHRSLQTRSFVMYNPDADHKT